MYRIINELRVDSWTRYIIQVKIFRRNKLTRTDCYRIGNIFYLSLNEL